MSLPQYGFSTEVDFEKLINDNHFLFRVYTPKAPSPADANDTSEIFFVASKFDEKFVRSPEEIKGLKLGYDSAQRHIGTYEDVAVHMDWSTRSKSSYVSTSFSFIWSIWEALRRYHLGIKKDIEIAVIDASAVTHRAATAVQLLQVAPSSCRRSEHWKWYRYAQESQSVLVHEYIPASAVLASIPLPSLLEKLPSYFLCNDIPQSSNSSNLASIGWDYGEKKRNYRRFCQEMSNRFLQSSPETRLQDTSAGSVRLALAFLRPWFHSCVVDDFPTATVTLCALSFNIAQWPGQWWAQEHSELWDLICAMVISLAEEVREAEGNRNTKEIVRLQGVIVELEDAVEKYKEEISTRTARKPTHHLTPLLIPPPLRPAALPISPSPLCLVSLPGTSASKAVKTPITPPTSPVRSSARAFPLEEVFSSSTTILSLDGPDALHDEDVFIESTSSSVVLEQQHLPESPDSDGESIHIAIQPPASVDPQMTPDSPSDPIGVEYDSSNWVMMDALLPNNRHPVCKTPSMAETASCVVTGFLIGAFITLCLLSPQRRTLLTHLT